MEEKSEVRNLKHKSYLLLLKYLPHLVAILCMVYTLLQFIDIDAIIIGYIINYILVGYVLICSIIFKFCYVHRFPIYYYIANELTSIIDTYVIQIPVDEKGLLGIHLTIIGIIILCYTRYYLKYVRGNKKCFKVVT
jgi:ABC-type polysaccharide transport system permease subunit